MASAKPRVHSWALSQTADKGSGECAVCHEVYQLHNKNGKVNLHGPREDRCPGSNKAPCSILREGRRPVLSCSQPPGSSTVPSAIDSIETTQNSPTAGVSQPRQGASSDGGGSATQFQWVPKQSGTIRHIPKSARTACANSLTAALTAIVATPENHATWLEVLNWAHRILHPPPKIGKKFKVAATIMQRLASTQEEEDSDPANRPRSVPKFEEDLVRAVSKKLEAGNMKAAIRLLSSEDSFAPPGVVTLTELRAKHPQRLITSSVSTSSVGSQPLA